MAVRTSILLIAVGAILRFAVTVTTTGFDIQAVGLILMIAGIVGLLLSIFMWSASGGPGGGGRYRRRRRIAPDGSGGYVEEDRTDTF